MQEIPIIVSILTRYQQHEKLTEEETQILESWLRESEAHEILFDDLSNEAGWQQEITELQAKDSSATWDRIRKRIEKMEEKSTVPLQSWKRYAAVAAIFAGAVLGTYLLVVRKNKSHVEERQSERFKNEVIAGTPQALLTLSNGKQIRLDTAGSGKLINNIWKTDSNNLVVLGEASTNPADQDILTTPTGTVYQLTLPDGSRVWLNAGSMLRFPSVFSGRERKVSLSGEGYFEITKNSQHPFVVETGTTMIRVLGTHFNIRNYDQEPAQKVTLLEGSVSLRSASDSILLRPGEQAVLPSDGKLRVDPVNAQQVVAWRESLFWFQNESFEQIMAELARWYPIHVNYRGQVNEKFTGILPRSRSLTEVLKTLELAGYVNFRIQGNEVEVIPRKMPADNP